MFTALHCIVRHTHETQMNVYSGTAANLSPSRTLANEDDVLAEQKHLITQVTGGIYTKDVSNKVIGQMGSPNSLLAVLVIEISIARLDMRTLGTL